MSCEPIEVGRVMLLPTITMQVIDPEIVAKNENYVRRTHGNNRLNDFIKHRLGATLKQL
jgi:hypothetical protein